ncbi:hypothetical protein OY671_011706, partial [Metschnikowia pulcherrima]
AHRLRRCHRRKTGFPCSPFAYSSRRIREARAAPSLVRPLSPSFTVHRNRHQPAGHELFAYAPGPTRHAVTRRPAGSRPPPGAGHPDAPPSPSPHARHHAPPAHPTGPAARRTDRPGPGP